MDASLLSSWNSFYSISNAKQLDEALPGMSRHENKQLQDGNEVFLSTSSP